MDAAEKLIYYLMCCVKTPVKVTIKAHFTWMEILNRYIGMLPMIKNSSLVVASTELKNIPFTKATHASIILSQLPLVWRNQCNLTLQTVLESPRAMLQDLESIEKVIAERYNDKARTDKAKAKAATAPKANEPVCSSLEPPGHRGTHCRGAVIHLDRALDGLLYLWTNLSGREHWWVREGDLTVWVLRTL